MSDNGTEFTTPMGRIVWGHPVKANDKTDDNNQKVIDPKTGQPVQQWAFGVAFDKAEFEQQIWPNLAAETAKGYPNGAPPKFSYKYKDGDSTEAVWANGKQLPAYAEREGYAGCYILTFSTEFKAPDLFQFVNGAYVQLQPEQIKTGDYVIVGANTKWHAGQSPGLYINPLTVLLCYEGNALGGSYSVDPNAMFGATPQMPQMPEGARAVGAAPAAETAPSGTMPGMNAQPAQGGMPGQPAQGGMPGQPAQGGMPGQPAQGGMPGQPAQGGMPGQPAQGGMPGQPGQGGMPGQPPAPATDFIPQQQGQPAQGGMPGQMPPR